MSLKIAGSLLKQKRFLPLFALFQAGTFNDNALKNALIALVTFGGVVLFSENIPRGSIVPLAALLFTLPFLILCTIAGQIADKVDRGLILKWIKRAEVCIMVVAAIGFFLESTMILAITLVGMGAQSAFFSPTKNSVLPQWLKDDELITGNSLMSGFQFFFILLGQSAGTLLVLMKFPETGFLNGPRVVAIILILLSLVGWYAAEKVPPAPAPKPDLKINYNPITAIYHALKDAWANQPVFRPMLGIAWFYGLSTIFVTAFPIYIADVMQYDQWVLTAVLVFSTVGILVGSLLCVVLARGRESIGLTAIGIVGVALFTLDLYLNSQQSARTELGDLTAFWASPDSKRFLVDVVGASLSAGLYVVPLQAMAQRRADPDNRARMMSAGAVLLNLAVNTVTFGLYFLGFVKSVPPRAPFLFIVLVSLVVAAYCIWRTFHPHEYESHAGE
jgi:MFS family permease